MRRSRRTTPDIAIVDVFLEDGPSGLEVARTLRSNPGTALTFIIAVSGTTPGLAASGP